MPGVPLTDLAAEHWTREATRLHRRYLLEVVEACGLCPWAVQARLTDRVRVAVVLEEDDALFAPSLAALDAWAADGPMEVGFLLYPRLPLRRLEFDQLTARLRTTDSERHALGAAPFALASFHPQAEPDLVEAERLVPFLRRTPDPCIQVVRMTALARVRSKTPEGTRFFDVTSLDMLQPEGPPLRERIARANLETVQRMGVEQLRGLMDAIGRDRDATYAELVRPR